MILSSSLAGIGGPCGPRFAYCEVGIPIPSGRFLWGPDSAGGCELASAMLLEKVTLPAAMRSAARYRGSVFAVSYASVIATRADHWHWPLAQSRFPSESGGVKRPRRRARLTPSNGAFREARGQLCGVRRATPLPPVTRAGLVSVPRRRCRLPSIPSRAAIFPSSRRPCLAARRRTTA